MQSYLVETPKQSLPRVGLAQYVWKIDKERAYRGCDLFELFPFLINSYLREYQEELAALVERERYIRITCWDGDGCSFYKANSLATDGCNSKECQDLLISCGCRGINIPCEIRLGPFWHLLMVNKLAPCTRSITALNTWMVGRDQYPTENEADVLRAERTGRIFVVRTANNPRDSHRPATISKVLCAASAAAAAAA